MAIEAADTKEQDRTAIFTDTSLYFMTLNISPRFVISFQLCLKRKESTVTG
jgi:hypothetical protein